MSMSTMRSRLEALPTYWRGRGEIKAEYFNRARLALLRLGSPLRLPLPRLRGLDLVLTDDCWVCVDRSLNDVPVIAWLDFASHGRISLVAPIACELRHYHAHAARLLDTLWDDMLAELDAKLESPRGSTG
jgi:hypothetical protein